METEIDLSDQLLQPDRRSSLPIIGQLLDRRKMEKKYRDFDLSTAEGLDREYDLIEMVAGIKLKHRPGVQTWLMSFSTYDFLFNVIKIQNLLNKSEQRYAFWHETGHAFFQQNPVWQRFTEGTLQKMRKDRDIPDKYPEPLSFLKDLVLEEGLTRFLMIPVMEKISPYVDKWFREEIQRCKRQDIKAIIPLHFKDWVSRIQRDIEKSIAEVENYLGEDDGTVRILNREFARVRLFLLMVNFQETGHYMGTNYVFRIAREQGLKTIDEVLQAITANPPKNWEELLGIV